MIVIADSGSTKTQWVLLNGAKVVVDITTKGFNPYYYDAEEVSALQNSIMDLSAVLIRIKKMYQAKTV